MMLRSPMPERVLGSAFSPKAQRKTSRLEVSSIEEFGAITSATDPYIALDTPGVELSASAALAAISLANPISTGDIFAREALVMPALGAYLFSRHFTTNIRRTGQSSRFFRMLSCISWTLMFPSVRNSTPLLISKKRNVDKQVIFAINKCDLVGNAPRSSRLSQASRLLRPWKINLAFSYPSLVLVMSDVGHSRSSGINIFYFCLHVLSDSKHGNDTDHIGSRNPGSMGFVSIPYGTNSGIPCIDEPLVRGGISHSAPSSVHSDKWQISVGFIGYPNVGKTSVNNCLKKFCTVAPFPGETMDISHPLPGIVPTSAHDSEADSVLKGVLRPQESLYTSEFIHALLDRVRPVYLTRTYDLPSHLRADLDPQGLDMP
ncbi:hypothetical protein BS47DRAFT_1481589 [Hydnum rufescens UP504]|uniref:G domain-containing protein n=1 Tax=Hydnum rufescens UP504 TaxID=1448309 RepID=A0A9P6E2G3_9AGAM|nr:hypothetical protein BS47DRAFT_1481589 [Hydnum rufescens UP504]